MTLVNSSQTSPDLQALSDRLSALENLLGLFGAATPAAAGTNGLVKGAAIGQAAYLLRGDQTWQDPGYFLNKSEGDAKYLSGAGGTQIKKILSKSLIISLEEMPPNSYLQRTTALAGAVVGSYCSVVPIIDNIVSNDFWTFNVFAQVLTPNIVTLHFKNNWLGRLDLPDFWVRILTIEF